MPGLQFTFSFRCASNTWVGLDGGESVREESRVRKEALSMEATVGFCHLGKSCRLGIQQYCHEG